MIHVLTASQRVHADGELCTAEPSDFLPLAQAQFIF